MLSPRLLRPVLSQAYIVRPPVATRLLTTTRRAMSSEKKQDPKVLEVTDVPCEDCKWVKLRKIKWQDQTGRDRVWETAERSTRKGEIDAVAMVALLHHPNKPTSIVIEEQFRPPINNVCIELPAGLVDEGESAEQAALRELKEETGYGGDGPGAGKVEVVEVTPLLVSDPGLTSANMRLVILNVHLSADDPEPEPKLDEGEFIVKRVVPLTGLWPLLKDYDKKGYTLDARLSHWAFGWHMGHSDGSAK